VGDPSPTFFLPLPEGGGGLRWGSLLQSSPFPLGRGRTQVGDRNFLPQLTPSLYSSPLRKGEEIEGEGRGRTKEGEEFYASGFTLQVLRFRFYASGFTLQVLRFRFYASGFN